MTLYILIGFVALIIIFSIYLILKGKIRSPRHQSPYVDALHLILEGKNDEALECLKKTVKSDTENIMAYIQLGDIFRKKGNPTRAAKIHSNLLVRSNLSDQQLNTILRHLVIDYQNAGMLNKASEIAERLNQRMRRNPEIQQLLLSLYEEKGDWDKAFFTRQNINKWLKKHDQYILALYKVQSGLKAIKKGAEREGRIRFREAIRLNKKCIPAYLFWGDSYRRENRNEDAFHVWSEFIKKNPEWAHLAFNRLKEVLFDLGQYGDLEEIYKVVIRNKPKNPKASINLVEIYKKQGRLDEAIEICEDVLEISPDLSECRYALVNILKQAGNEKKALSEAMKILDQETAKHEQYRCQECGFEQKEPFWYCPQCHQWDTALTEK
jgi:lipopolysaccharide biosynthesis regulator YciM